MLAANFDAAPQLLVDGIVDAVFFSMLALSWGLIFATTRTFHFAHALTLTVGAYAAVSIGGWVPIALVGAALCGAVLGAASEVALYRPLRARKALTLNIFLASLGLLLAGEALIQWAYGSGSRRLKGGPDGGIDIGSARLSHLDTTIVVVSVVVVVAAVVFLQRSRVGLAVQALASNPDLGRSIGVDQERTYLLVFLVGSAIAGLAGGLLALRDAATATMGVEPLLVAFAAVFVGGIGSIPGTLLGAVLLGLSQSLSGVILPGRLQAVTTFVILFAVLLLRPVGLIPRTVDR